ncbi:hypothetical protein GSB9_01252 [Flavobacteriaceae bacterium GSB9]|nr:hypothetical protein GSB9_01252 [Flavobacteriaceae bacterium GSB9]
MKHFFITITFSALCLLNCANDSEDDLVDSKPLPSIVTYEDDVKSIIDDNCISCHSNPPISAANVPLVTYANVKSAVQNNNLIGKINGTASGALMPLGGPKLPQNLIDLIEKWESDGLLEN